MEGLERLENLRELHIEKQTLPPGEKLLFEPRSLQALAVSILQCLLRWQSDITDIIIMNQFSQGYCEQTELLKLFVEIHFKCVGCLNIT